MTRTELKQKAQDALMSAAQTAFGKDEVDQELRDEMDQQLQRIERLFGYELGSWGRSA